MSNKLKTLTEGQRANLSGILAAIHIDELWNSCDVTCFDERELLLSQLREAISLLIFPSIEIECVYFFTQVRSWIAPHFTFPDD